jgi:Proprotein convertase P-domain
MHRVTPAHAFAVFLPLILAAALMGCSDDGTCDQNNQNNNGSEGATCSDGLQNGDELGVDCGGLCAARCPDSTQCTEHEQCQNGFCHPTTAVCTTPTCVDAFQNQDETDVDCGGTCGATCVTGEACVANGDCVSDLCDPASDQCVVASSYNAVPFTVIEGVTPSEWAGWSDARTVLRSAAEFQTALGVAPPPEVDFTTQWVLFHSVGKRPFPGHVTAVDELEVESMGADLRVSTTLHEPGPSCETFVYSVPTWSLVRFDQIPGLQSVITEDRTVTPIDCTSGAAAEANCDLQTPCGPDLICAGITGSSQGFCKEVGQWGVFAETHPVPIPDDGASSLTRTIVASGLATVDMDVVIKVELTHPDASELTITLSNPGGTVVGVWAGETAPGQDLVLERPVLGFSGDESVNGNWTLTLTDGTTGNAGLLLGWSVEITSRWD